MPVSLIIIANAVAVHIHIILAAVILWQAISVISIAVVTNAIVILVYKIADGSKITANAAACIGKILPIPPAASPACRKCACHSH